MQPRGLEAIGVGGLEDYALPPTMLDRLKKLRALRKPSVPGFLAKVRELILVASSSRAGSSMLAEVLRGSERLLHLRAEINPYFRLVDLAFPARGIDSDRLDAGHWTALDALSQARLEQELALDVGTPAEAIEDDEQFLLDAIWRINIQWPRADVSLEHALQAGREVLAQLGEKNGGARIADTDMLSFQILLLRRLQGMGADIVPRYYDIPEALLQKHFPGPLAATFPGDLVVEEPPFILPRPWHRVNERDLKTKALVIKTPSNAYRLPFLRALFPNAAVKIVHLTRNPAASINGLYDGWRHGGFHSHRMREPLRIPGYSDHCPFDAKWWKFDLPPSWQEYAAAPLPEVCAFQWRAAHEAILAFVRAAKPQYIQLRYEDLIRSAKSRRETMERLSHDLAIPFNDRAQQLADDGIRPVMATATPRANRWRDRSELLKQALDSKVRKTAEELGYGPESEWI